MLRIEVQDDWTLPRAEKLVVVPDVHGDLRKARQSLMSCGVLDARGEWTAPPGTVVVQLGDQVDSRPRQRPHRHSCGEGLADDSSVLRFFDDLDGRARASGGRVVSLVGNHELMNLLGNFSYTKDHGCERCCTDRALYFSPRGQGGGILSRRPVIVRVGTVLLCHAGLLPSHVAALRSLGTGLEAFNAAFRGLATAEPAGGLERVQGLLHDQDGILTHRRFSPDGAGGMPRASDVRAMLAATGSSTMVIGHHAHRPGSTSLLGGLVWVLDPGMSAALYDAPGTALVF
jgi:hypothetical protein